MSEALPTLIDAIGAVPAAEVGILAAAHALGRCAPYRARWRPAVVPLVMTAGVLTLRAFTLADLILVVVVTALALLPEAPSPRPPGRAMQRWVWTDVGIPVAIVGAWLLLRGCTTLAGIDLAAAVMPVVSAPELVRTCLGIAAYAWVCRPASEGVGALLDDFGGAPAAPFGGATGVATPADVGWLIGTLERLAVLTLTLLGQWEAIGFVLTAKSIARFAELNDRRFSELYLTGTLASVGMGAGVGLGLRALL